MGEFGVMSMEGLKRGERRGKWRSAEGERLAKRQRRMSPLEHAIEQVDGTVGMWRTLPYSWIFSRRMMGVTMVYGITTDKDARRAYGRNKACKLKQVSGICIATAEQKGGAL